MSNRQTVDVFGIGSRVSLGQRHSTAIFDHSSSKGRDRLAASQHDKTDMTSNFLTFATRDMGAWSFVVNTRLGRNAYFQFEDWDAPCRIECQGWATNRVNRAVNVNCTMYSMWLHNRTFHNSEICVRQRACSKVSEPELLIGQDKECFCFFVVVE